MTSARSEKSARFMELETLQRRQQKTIYESYLGREVNVLAEAVSSKSEADFTGHTTCHKVVNFPKAIDATWRSGKGSNYQRQKEQPLWGSISRGVIAESSEQAGDSLWKSRSKFGR